MKLLYAIKIHLPQSSDSSLAQTCRRFRAIRWHIAPNTEPWQPGDMVSSSSERCVFLCMLEKDRSITSTRAVCSHCVRTHERSLFSWTALQKDPSVRRCIGAKYSMWVCPHQVFDHTRARAVHASSNDRANSGATMPCYKCKKKGHSVGLTNGCVSLGRHLWNVTPGVTITKEDVTKALKLFDVRICPHIRLSDPAVLEHYSPDCKAFVESDKKPNYRPCSCKNCSARQKICASCNTCFAFNIPRSRSDMQTLHVVVWRKLPVSEVVTDPA